MTGAAEPRPTAVILPFRKPFYTELVDLIESYPDVLIPDAVYALRRAIKILQNGVPK
jgi:hypothetical protein